MWGEDRAITEQRIEDPGQAASERHDRDGLPAAGGDMEGPGPKRLGLGRPAPENRDGGLDEKPAHATGAGLGDGAAPLCVARAALVRHEAEVGLELVRVGKRWTSSIVATKAAAVTGPMLGTERPRGTCSS